MAYTVVMTRPNPPAVDPSRLQNALHNSLHNAAAAVQNSLADLPGERPVWIVIDLTGSYPARTRRRKLSEFPPDLGRRETSLEDLGARLRILADTPWLTGVTFRLEDFRADLTTSYALRRLIATLRAAGKKTQMLLHSLDMRSYYLASAADEIIAPESADLSLTGFGLEVAYLKDALARYGVAFEVLTVGDYKSAFSTLTREQMSNPEREQLEAVLTTLEATFCNEVAAARGVTPERVRGWLEQGVTSATEAKALGLIDRVAYEDEVVGRGYARYRDKARLLRRRFRPVTEKRVAVVTLEGAIVPGRSRRSPAPVPLVGGTQAGAETLQRIFRQLEQDDSVAAVVFYVASGGGSALASDLIWREVRRVKAQKPVVAVMGSVAASGGYYVLCHADHIIAAPTTVTGSIGVVSLKPLLAEFNRKVGINPEPISRNRFALTMSPSRPYSDDERTFVKRSLDDIYTRFTTRVADGRKLSRTRVHELAQGRVWSGADALAVGLIDELGDLGSGLSRAKEIAGLSEDAAVWTVEVPAKPLLPTADDPTTLLRTLEPFGRERVLLLNPTLLTLR